MREIIIAENESGQRLDKLLAKYLKEAPKSFLYKMLRKKNIVLNGKKASGSEKLMIGDNVRLFLAEETIEKFTGDEIKVTEKAKTLDIIYEDQDVVFINKPVGMLSQRARENEESLNEHVIAYLLESGQITREELKTFHPAVCNRLDRNTSGLIVAGKSLTGLQVMSELFRTRTLNKFYWCLVHGCIKKGEKIDGYLTKNEQTNKVQVTASSKADKKIKADADYIQTEYVPVKIGKNLTLLEVHLITGKTHQIRSHLASIGHPVIGDYKYGIKSVNDEYKQKYGLKSQLLHSYRLEMPVLEKQLSQLSGRAFTAKLPAAFERIARDRGVL